MTELKLLLGKPKIALINMQRREEDLHRKNEFLQRVLKELDLLREKKRKV